MSTFQPPNVRSKQSIDVDSMNKKIASSLHNMRTAGRPASMKSMHERRRAARMFRPQFAFSKVSSCDGGGLGDGASPSGARSRRGERGERGERALAKPSSVALRSTDGGKVVVAVAAVALAAAVAWELAPPTWRRRLGDPRRLRRRPVRFRRRPVRFRRRQLARRLAVRRRRPPPSPSVWRPLPARLPPRWRW